MSKRSYTPEERAACLAALAANGGNLAKTAQQCGVPRKTLAEWARIIKSASGGEGVADRSPVKTPTAQEAHALVAPAKASLCQKLDAIADSLADDLGQPERRMTATVVQIATALAIVIDKARLLRGQSTSVSTVLLSLEQATAADREMEEWEHERTAIISRDAAAPAP